MGALAVLLGAIGTFSSYQPTTPKLDIPFGPSMDLGEPGFNALGMLITALVTVPLALLGAELSLVGWRRNPKGPGRFALTLNVVYGLVIVVAALAAW